MKEVKGGAKGKGLGDTRVPWCCVRGLDLPLLLLAVVVQGDRQLAFHLVEPMHRNASNQMLFVNEKGGERKKEGK